MRLPSLGCVLQLAALAILTTSCVTVYQPLTSLQRPVVIDTQVENFQGVRLEIRCIPGDLLDRTGANVLCRKLKTLFTNQGALVRTIATANAEESESDDESAEGEGLQGPPDLIMTLRARELHVQRNTILWVVSIGTLTILPAVNEYTFAQDVTIRDRTGFLLGSDSLQGRFVRYVGAGAWAANWLLDMLVREPSEKLTGGAVERDFSRDFYGQLSQIVFNARMRQSVLASAYSPTVPVPESMPAPGAAPDRTAAEQPAPDRAASDKTAGKAATSKPPSGEAATRGTTAGDKAEAQNASTEGAR